MAKKKTVVEEVKLQDAPVLRSSGDAVDPETEAETDPAPERKPWVDFIPPYVKDNAKGYPRYVDKLAEALNGVVEGGGGGGSGDGRTLIKLSWEYGAGDHGEPVVTLPMTDTELIERLNNGEKFSAYGEITGFEEGVTFNTPTAPIDFTVATYDEVTVYTVYWGCTAVLDNAPYGLNYMLGGAYVGEEWQSDVEANFFELATGSPSAPVADEEILVDQSTNTYLRRYGSVVVMTCGNANTEQSGVPFSTIKGWTIPTDYRPSTHIPIVAINRTYSDNVARETAYLIEVNTAGKFTKGNNSPLTDETKRLAFTATWCLPVSNS